METKNAWNDFLGGNEEAFSELYRTYRQEIFAYGVKIGFDPDVCKDAAQDVFYNLYLHRKKLTYIENIEFYLIQCMKNRLLDLYNREVKIRKINYDDLVLPNEEGIMEQIIDKEQLQQTKEAVSRSLKRLSPKQRKIIHYHYQLNLEIHEIAAILEMSPTAVRKSLYRGLKKMKSISSQIIRTLFFLATV